MRNKNDTEEIEIDLLHLLSVLWHKAWIIALSIIVCGGMAFSYSYFGITPLYKARAMMYVNNTAISLGGTSFSISSGELTAAKSLLDIYVIILGSRTTMEAVIEEADLPYTYEQLSAMVTAGSVNDTEVFEIVATSPNPEEAKLIVNTITDILPDRIADIVDGSSVRIVDSAVTPTAKSSPSNTRNALIGALLGAVISCGVIVVIDLFNNTIRDEQYLTERYELPILASVPDMYRNGTSSYGDYYSGYHQNSKNA